MKNRYLIASVLLPASIALILSFIFTSSSTLGTSNSTPGMSSGIARIKRIELGPQVSSRLPIRDESTNSQQVLINIEAALQEIDTRLNIDQTDEALNELDGLLDRFDAMSHSEKVDLLTAYATYFLKNSYNDDARFFYEQILLLPELEQSNRLAVLQMLARIAMSSEDWTGFLAYNDQYFDVGGGYNWVVTGQLASAYLSLEDYDSTGKSMLLHFDTGIHPEYDDSNEQYQKRYARYESVPLRMTNLNEALTFAQAMVNRFDKPANWRVLSELYQSQGESLNYDRTIEIARIKGFIDPSGKWQD